MVEANDDEDDFFSNLSLASFLSDFLDDCPLPRERRFLKPFIMMGGVVVVVRANI